MSEEKKSVRVVTILKKPDYIKLEEMANKERMSVSALIRHFIIRKIYDPFDVPKIDGSGK